MVKHLYMEVGSWQPSGTAVAGIGVCLTSMSATSVWSRGNDVTSSNLFFGKDCPNLANKLPVFLNADNNDALLELLNRPVHHHRELPNIVAMNGHFAPVGNGPTAQQYEHGIQVIDEEKEFKSVHSFLATYPDRERHNR